MPLAVPVVEPRPSPAYQQIAAKVEHLLALGVSSRATAHRLRSDRKAVARALRWLEEMGHPWRRIRHQHVGRASPDRCG